MIRALTYIETEKNDLCHEIGQELMRPFSIAFGHSYRIKDKAVENPSSTVKKIIVISIAILVLPVTLLSLCIGAPLLAYSSTHKKRYQQIPKPLNHVPKQIIHPVDNPVNKPVGIPEPIKIDGHENLKPIEIEVPQKPIIHPKPIEIPKAKDSVNDYEFDFLKDIANQIIVNPYYKSLISRDYYEFLEVPMHGDFTHKVVLPDTPEKIKIYNEIVPNIVSQARFEVEKSLEKAVPISELLNELAKNRWKLFPYIF